MENKFYREHQLGWSQRCRLRSYWERIRSLGAGGRQEEVMADAHPSQQPEREAVLTTRIRPRPNPTPVLRRGTVTPFALQPRLNHMAS